jgi:carbon-monoxide dehydrogenase large subunit
MGSTLATEVTVLKKKGWVGRSVRRKEDLRLVTGKGTYVDDVRLPDVLHAAFLRSTYAHARIVRVDLTETLNTPGVVYAVHGGQLAKPLPSWMNYPGMRNPSRYSLAVNRVRYVGEPVAAVVAEDRYQAEDALEMIDVEYEPLEPVVNMEKALQPGSSLLYDEWGDNVLLYKRFSGGDIEKAIQEADLVIRERLTSHRISAAFIENRGILAHYDPISDHLDVWASTQFPHVLRTYLSQITGHPEHKIRVVAPHVGGGFGPKSNVFPDEVTTVLLSMKLGRPVKWIEERKEHLQACAHSNEQVHYAEMAVRKDGTILGVRDKIIADLGVYGPFWTEAQPAMLSAIALPGPYLISNYQADLYCVVTNKAPMGAIRPFGRGVGAFVMERLVDIAAKDLGMDPADLRLKNVVPGDMMPYSAVTGVVYDTGNYPLCLKRVIDLSDYYTLKEKAVEERKKGKYVGVGMSMYVEYTAPNSLRLQGKLGWAVGGYEPAMIRVSPLGKVSVYVGIVSQGQAHQTILSQIVADELGVHFEDVLVEQGDTDKTPYGQGTWASRSTVTAGGACVLAARKLREKMAYIAAQMLSTRPDEIEIRDRKAYRRDDPSKFVTVADIAGMAIRTPSLLPAGMEPGLEVTVHFEPEVPTTCSYAAHVATVEVDPDTGAVRVLKYYVMDDAGIIINPQTVYGQIHGGLAMGAAFAMYENHVYDENGQLLTGTFMDYLIPTAREIDFDVIADHMETPSRNPGGFKGMAEGPTIPTAATIANALDDALSPLGVRVLGTPISPEATLSLIKNRKTILAAPC